MSMTMQDANQHLQVEPGWQGHSHHDIQGYRIDPSHAPLSPMSPYILVERVKSSQPTKGFFDYELPKTVASARDGWQWTSQSGAVVSGLLAAVAAQLLGMFKGDEDIGPKGAKDFLVAVCYAAIFLNINATIGSFVLVDNLGEVGYEAAKRDAANQLAHFSHVGNYSGGVSTLLKDFGASGLWTIMLVHWLCTFYLGILTLIIALLTYVMLAEPFAVKVVMAILVAVTLLPTTYFIFFRGFGKGKRAIQEHDDGNGEKGL